MTATKDSAAIDSAMMDEALVRPNRFSTNIALDIPDAETRWKMYILQRCRKLELSEQGLCAWLGQYSRDYPGHLQAAVGEHEFWSVPSDLMLESTRHILTPAGRDSNFLARCIEDDAILAVRPIAPVPSWFAIKTQAVLSIVIPVAFALGMWVTDPFLKWGKKTCPQCFSRKKMVPFTCTSADEVPHTFCDGCNTIWSPRR